MTEEEFKTSYVKSFLEAYKTVVGFKEFYFPTVPSSIEELRKTADSKAQAAWQNYLKEKQ